MHQNVNITMKSVYLCSEAFDVCNIQQVILFPLIHRPAPKNEDEMMEAIFECIDRLFAIVRPRKVLYMAIDGVVSMIFVASPYEFNKNKKQARLNSKQDRI